MLGRIIWFFTWWLRKPLLKTIKAQVSPSQLQDALNLDPNVPVCYVLPWRSYVDRWVLEHVVAQQGLVPMRRSRGEVSESAARDFLAQRARRASAARRPFSTARAWRSASSAATYVWSNSVDLTAQLLANFRGLVLGC